MNGLISNPWTKLNRQKEQQKGSGDLSTVFFRPKTLPTLLFEQAGNKQKSTYKPEISVLKNDLTIITVEQQKIRIVAKILRSRDINYLSGSRQTSTDIAVCFLTKPFKTE